MAAGSVGDGGRHEQRPAARLRPRGVEGDAVPAGAPGAAGVRPRGRLPAARDRGAARRQHADLPPARRAPRDPALACSSLLQSATHHRGTQPLPTYPQSSQRTEFRYTHQNPQTFSGSELQTCSRLCLLERWNFSTRIKNQTLFLIARCRRVCAYVVGKGNESAANNNQVVFVFHWGDIYSSKLYTNSTFRMVTQTMLGQHHPMPNGSSKSCNHTCSSIFNSKPLD